MPIRPARSTDAPELARLATQLGYPSTTAQVVRRLEAFFSKSECAVFVAEGEGGALAGFVSVQSRHQIESDPDAVIEGLVVDASDRRRGVGRALMAEAEGWARGQGLGRVRLRSNTIRTEARAFYESIGYRVVKTQNAFQKTLI